MRPPRIRCLAHRSLVADLQLPPGGVLWATSLLGPLVVCLFALMGAGFALAGGEDSASEVAQRLSKQLVRVPSNERRTEILDEMIALANSDNDAAFVLSLIHI